MRITRARRQWMGIGAAVTAFVAGLSLSPAALGQSPARPSDPVPIRQPRPAYTEAALQAKIRGAVELSVVILPNGTVGDVRVTKSLDSVYGLDEQAIKAAKQWLFRPALLNGRPVAFTTVMILTFNAPDMAVATGITAEDEFVRGVYALNYPGLSAPLPTLTPQMTSRRQAMAANAPTVEVDAVISVQGTVARARVVRSSSATSAATVEAARQQVLSWRFEPARLAGSVVPVVVRFTVPVGSGLYY